MCSGGINPDIHLFTQSKGLVKWDDKLITFKPDTTFSKHNHIRISKWKL